MTTLSVNVNKVALLRNSREGEKPSVLWATKTLIEAGASGVTVHPRPDQRHIRPGDVVALTDFLQSHPTIEFNIEGNPFAIRRDNGYPGFDALIEAARPTQATLVPDGDNQLTSDHGFDLSGDNARLIDHIARYQAQGARVSLFMDPDLIQIDLAKKIGADRIELYTGPFAHLASTKGLDAPQTLASLEGYRAATVHATRIGLGVNAGHDLDLHNLPLFCSIPDILEVSIGHALVADALALGLATAVGAYLLAINGAHGQR